MVEFRNNRIRTAGLKRLSQIDEIEQRTAPSFINREGVSIGSVAARKLNPDRFSKPVRIGNATNDATSSGTSPLPTPNSSLATRVKSSRAGRLLIPMLLVLLLVISSMGYAQIGLYIKNYPYQTINFVMNGDEGEVVVEQIKGNQLFVYSGGKRENGMYAFVLKDKRIVFPLGDDQNFRIVADYNSPDIQQTVQINGSDDNRCYQEFSLLVTNRDLQHYWEQKKEEIHDAFIKSCMQLLLPANRSGDRKTPSVDSKGEQLKKPPKERFRKQLSQAPGYTQPMAEMLIEETINLADGQLHLTSGLPENNDNVGPMAEMLIEEPTSLADGQLHLISGLLKK